MAIEKVHFTEEKETMLITLYGKALDSRSNNSVLGDTWADEAIKRIDYDFGRLKVSKGESLSMAIRSKSFDVWTAKFLADHPDATVVHLGCGMDSRVFRITPPAGVRWFDVDYPEVIELRRRLYPERTGYSLIGTSLADLGWVDELPADRPAMIVAEGVMMYLTEEVVKPLLYRLTKHFPSGEMAFDAFSELGLRLAKSRPSVKGTGASFGWGITDPRDLKTRAPKLELVTELRIPDMAAYSRLPWTMRAMVRALEPFPALRRMNRLLLYRF